MKNQIPLHYREFLRKAYVVQLTQGSFSAASLARKTGKSYGYSSRILKDMLGSGLVRRVAGKSVLGSGGRGNLMGFSPARYMMTSKGRSRIHVVLAGGVFDIIHPGHLHFLEEARTHGNVLVAVIASDSTVRSRKRRPVNVEKDRLWVMSSLRQVDLAILGSASTNGTLSGVHAGTQRHPKGHKGTSGREETIKKVRPDIICIGYDQEDDLARVKAILRETGIRCEIARASRSLPGHSTSSIIRAIKASRCYNKP